MSEGGVLLAAGTTASVDGGVLVPGAVPLGDAEEVFRVLALALGDQLQRLPDGETGERSGGKSWQHRVLRQSHGLEASSRGVGLHGELPQLRLRPGVTASTAGIGPLGYADAALRSYQPFAFLKTAGVIPHHCRFQVSLPTPLSPVVSFVDDRDRTDVEAAYEAALLAELEIITTFVPSDQLAVQWNAGVELPIIEGEVPAHFSDAEGGVLERLLHLADVVPDEVELGFHVCQPPRRAAMEHAPDNGRALTRLATALVAGSRRSVDWLHLPVPDDRIDMRFFELVAGMPLGTSTSLYLGLIHGDGHLGAEARIVAAQRFIAHFGVATACAWAAAGPTVDELIDLHQWVTLPGSAPAAGA